MTVRIGGEGMRMSFENILRRADRAPMLKALVPLVAGIVVAGRWSLPVWGAAAGLAVSVAGAFVLRRWTAADICIAAAMFFAGWCAVEVRPAPRAPEGERVMEIVVDEVLSRRGGETVAEGRIAAFAADGGVERCGAAVRIWAAREVALGEGERVEALCEVRPFAADGYGLYMSRRGVAGTVFLDPSRVMRRAEGTLPWAQRLRHVAAERISRLGLDPAAEAVTAAMTVGDRTGLTPEMRRRYSLGGVSHLLAVSGLHVGFVFVIVNLLLWWVPVLRHGYVWRCLLAVAAIWVYAAVTGFPPSVVRAAAMFSVFQISMAATVRFDSLNSLCLTACLMLLFDARTLYDAGFRLSFLSVAAILEWGVPLYRVAARRVMPTSANAPRGFGERTAYALRRWCRSALLWLWGGVAMGAAASVATMPLVSYLFGTVSLWSVAAGPAAVLLSGVAVGAAAVWILFPVPFLQPLAAWVTGTAAGGLEALVTACAESGSLAFEAAAGGVATAAAYTAMAIFTLWLWSLGRR